MVSDSQVVEAAKASAICKEGLIEPYEVAAFLRGVEWAANKWKSKAETYDRMMDSHDFVDYE